MPSFKEVCRNALAVTVILSFEHSKVMEPLIEILLNAGIDPTYRKAATDGTALEHAIHHPSPTILQMLIKAGADLSDQGVEGKTALHYAVEFSHDKIPYLLHGGGQNRRAGQSRVYSLGSGKGIGMRSRARSLNGMISFIYSKFI
ncbi:hypothetical protein EMCG_08409 [[Emmonsia] crescens]|uniref:Uncharacterized protein n=1 Tax=[Emmonsia] crescens TaxID=73230 RepID=A0A0G2I5R3_9EURO|nr:hypothetical protein EMCG_08409 [Emmonsia crescens UAMH 3008]